MPVHVRQNAVYFVPPQRFFEKCRSESSLVYADEIRKRIGAVILLGLWGGGIVYLAWWSFDLFSIQAWREQDFSWQLIRIISFALLVFMVLTAPTIWNLARNSWTRIEIIMNRSDQRVSFRYYHFLKAPTNVEFLGKDVADVVVNRMEWPGTPVKCWWVWLYMRDGARKVIDGCRNKEPIRKLAADLAEVLHVSLKEIP
jgi:hypothetical protein